MKPSDQIFHNFFPALVCKQLELIWSLWNQHSNIHYDKEIQPFDV